MTDERNGCWSCDFIDQGKKYWNCTCGCVWNPFETNGICPLCKYMWDYIQCPTCAYPRHKYSYYRNKMKTIYCTDSTVRNCEGRPYLEVNIKGTPLGPAFYAMLDEAWKWLNYFSHKTDQKSNSVISAEKAGQLSDNGHFEPTHNIMKQIIQGKGLEIDNPINCNIIVGLELLTHLMPLKLIDCSEIDFHNQQEITIQKYRFQLNKSNNIITLYASK
jgi:hypothetical protein